MKHGVMRNTTCTIRMIVHAKPIFHVLPLVIGSILMAQTTINVKDLAADGVILTPSTSADFASQAATLVQTSGTNASLLPYSVIVKNLTQQTIRGYALKWSYVGTDGKTDGHYQLKQNFDPRQKGAELAAGQGHVISPLGELLPVAPTYAGGGALVSPDSLSRLAGQASISVSLDSVAFENGKVIGPNEGAAINVWMNMYAAQRDVGAAVLQKLRTSSAADTITWLHSQAAQGEVFPSNATMYDRLAGPSHWYQVYSRMSFERLLQFGKQSGNAMAVEAERMAETPVPALSR
jgi:hypothetical protein